MEEGWHAKSIQEVFDSLNTSHSGLTGEEVHNRLKEYGANTLQKKHKNPIPGIIINQFRSFIIWVLLLTAAISFIISHTIEGYVILTIIGFIILLNFFMEYKAAKDMQSLSKLVAKTATVIRNSQKMKIPSREIVPGDILVLNRGDILNADARIIECEGLSVDESVLTGESVPVNKITNVLHQETALAQRENMLFSGTQVMKGHGLAVVVATNFSTQFGKIGKLLSDIETQTTPLQKRLNILSRQIAIFAASLSMVAFIVGLFHSIQWTEMLIFSMAIIVSGIPESLPTVVAIALAIGVKKMAKHNAIIKRLPAVETLGTCSVICTDKTGTLTQNKMMVESIFTMQSEVAVTGQGYVPEGTFKRNNDTISIEEGSDLHTLMKIGLLCNNSDIKMADDLWLVDGEPTEAALVALARKAGIDRESLKDQKRLEEHSFDPKRKMMSTVHTLGEHRSVQAKGAPEFLLQRSAQYLDGDQAKDLDDNIREEFLKKNHNYASKGYRVLGLAYRDHAHSLEINEVEKDLVFVGLVAIRDPPDKLALESIKSCQEAGIKVVMITGDNKLTAAAIAKDLGILTPEDNILTGEELDMLTDAKEHEEFLRMIPTVTVYARTTPEHKLKIVENLQKKGHIVAMTGDGVNDAPALKKADIGIAMGQRGSDIAKESSELILKDDKFTTIAHAVEAGRTLYDNIRKFIYYVLVGSISEVLLILLAVIIGITLPLTALMVLFINLVTSEFPAIGLAVERPNRNIMRQKPRDPREGLLNDFIIMRIVSTVPLLILGSVALYIWEMFSTGNVAKAQTVTFATIIMFELFHTFNAKTWGESILNRSLFTNKALLVGVGVSFALMLFAIYFQPFQAVLGTTFLNLKDWVLIFCVSFSVIFHVELRKWFLKIELKEREKVEIFPTRG